MPCECDNTHKENGTVCVNCWEKGIRRFKGYPVLSWNTGRFYSTSGQRIVAVEMESGDVLFFDLDRKVDGKVPKPGMIPDFFQPLDKHRIMETYDSCRYNSLENPEEWKLRDLIMYGKEVLLTDDGEEVLFM